MWGDLLTAAALMMVFEGIMPFLSPRGYRSAMTQMANMPDRTLRIIGLVSMLAGVLVLYLSR